MVARVSNLTSSSSTAEYFHEEGGYYTAARGDREAARAKAAEHRQASAWYGQGAAALGLKAGQKVSAGAFETILQGHVIGTDIRLGRKRDGRHEHRPGFDITFSAPKSVSLAALLPTRKHPRGDRGVLRWHDEAVKATLDWIEETLVQTRGYDPATGRRPRVKGHGMAAALFRHIASRNLDPQLHTHAVVANMTRDGEGRWKSIEPTELHRNAILIGAYYRDQLARRLIRKGYSILPAMVGRMRSFEIAGYDRRVRDAFSSRRKQIEAFMDERGWDYSQAAAQVAALATRKRKAEPLHAMLRTIWADRARELGEVPIAKRSWRGVSLPAAPSALEIVGRAMEHLEERQSVFAAHQLEAVALSHSPGRHTLEEIRGAIAWMVRDRHLVEAGLRRADRAFVTDRALKSERKVIAMMKAGIGAGVPLAAEQEVAAHLANAGLTEGQEEAVRTILLTSDRVTGVQGRAGTGKTAMLRHVRELAGSRLAVGLAPSAAAARVLEQETDMPARTLHWFLARCRAVDDPGSGPGQAPGRVIDRLRERFRGAVLVLDEASMVSTDQMKRLMRVAEELEVARLVLVGDRRQLRAVEAGQPFRLLQKAGMTTAIMDEILRQREPRLRAAVNAAQEGEPGEAVELLGSSVHEVPWDELGQRAAETWLALDADTRARTLLVAPTHELRAEINAAVREALAAEGVLRGRALRIERLVGLGMTRAEKADVRNYREGDTVVPNQDLVNFRVKRDDVLTVTGIEEDRVVLMHPDGKPRHVAPQQKYYRYRLDVYETRPIEIRAGDRIRWTRNDRKRELVNGEQSEVVAIGRERVRFRRADGRTFSLAQDDPQLRHVDHAWSSTVHGAQGRTADGVIAVLDSGQGALADQSTFYVEISRARDSAVVLTDNCEQLVEVLEAHTGERATALEAVGEEIGPDLDTVRIPGKLPAWSPRREWTELEEKARNDGTILFRVEGYEGLIGRTRRLDERFPDLPAPIREVLDGLLAYDRGCREGDAGAVEFLGLLEVHFRRRAELEDEAAAKDRPLAELEDYPAWREKAGRLTANGKALLEDAGERAGEAGPRIAERLEDLDALLVLDDAVVKFETVRDDVNRRAAEAGTIPFYADGHDELLEVAHALSEYRLLPTGIQAAVEEVIAGAAAGERRREGIAAFRDETAGLVQEHDEMEARAGSEPPTALEGWRSWAARSEAADRHWKAMLDETGVWRPHLDRLPDSHAAIAAAIGRLTACRDWASLATEREKVVDRARTERVPPFYLKGWAAFAAKAKALSELEDLPAAAAVLAERILEYDRGCREARAAIAGFLDGAREHERRWDSLERQYRRRVRQNPTLSITEERDYRPLSQFAKALKETADPFLDEKNLRRHGVDFDGVRDGGACIAAQLERLRRHEPLDGFLDVMDRLARVRGEAEAGNVLAFHHDDWPGIVVKAEELQDDPELDEAERRRLQAVLDEHAARAAEWEIARMLLHALEELEEEERDLAARAENEGLPLTLLPDWRNWHDASRQFAKEAGAVLADEDLRRNGHWRSRPEKRTLLEKFVETAPDRDRLIRREDALVEDMVRAERARLRDPEAGHAFRQRWPGKEMLVEGDRLRVAYHPRLGRGELVVVAAGLAGGLASKDKLELEWVAPKRNDPHVDIRADELAEGPVRRADWTHEELRNAALMRERPVSSQRFSRLCNGDVVAGDLLRWTEYAAFDPSADDRLARTGGKAVVHVEAELVERRAALLPDADTCVLRETARSDGRPCGERTLPLARLTVGGCLRATWGREEEREAEALVQGRSLGEERQELWREELDIGRSWYWSMRRTP